MSAASSVNGVRFLSRNFGLPGQAGIETAIKRGAYEMLRRALTMKSEDVTALVKASGLRA